MSREIRIGAWDKGVDFEAMRQRLRKMYREVLYKLRHERLTAAELERLKRELSYTAIALIQLTNGLRAGEAVDVFRRFLETGEREFRIRSQKRGGERPVAIPVEISCSDRRYMVAIEYSAYKTWCRRRLGVNSHSLRYAYITYLARKGYPPQLIAKTTGHRKLDFVLHYTQQKAAEDIVRKMARGEL